MTITIQPELELFVEQEVASGEYRDASAVVAEGLRLLQQTRRHDALREESASASRRPNAGRSRRWI